MLDEQKLVNTFLSNLKFLKQSDEKLYLKVEALSQLIQEGEYKENYALEYLEDENGLDIYDIKNDIYLYVKKPNEINKNLIDRIKFDDKNLILGFEEELLKEYETIEDIENLKQNSEDNKQDLLIQGISRYTKVLKSKNKADKLKPKKIEKFIFFGTLLGAHIPTIAQKMNSYLYLVFEQNLEIFRLSLFTTDYSILKNRGDVIFAVDEENVSSKISSFLDNDFMNNSMIKFSSTHTNSQETLNEFLSVLISKRPTSYDYNRMLYTTLKCSSQYFSQDYPKLQLKRLKENFDFFGDKPILYLAGGPSLEENLLWVKENQNKFIIATIGAAYKTLLRNDIKVDLIFTLDGSFEVLDKLQFSKDDMKLLSDELILASMITDEKILNRFDKNKVFLYEMFFCFLKENFDISVSSVGEMGLALLLQMNAKNIYLIGLDMAINQKTGSTHATSSDSGISKYELNNDIETLGNSEEISAKTLIEVKGNMQDKVYTTGVFKTSIYQIIDILAKINNDVKVYNLSKNGAYFKNTTPKKIEEIKILDFEEVIFDKQKFTKELKKYSKVNLEDKEFIQKQIDYLENFVKNDLDKFLQVKYKTFDEFISSNVSFFQKLMQDEKAIYSLIFSNYFNIILNYLSLAFNDKNIWNEKQKINNVKEVMYKSVEELIEDILKYLKKMV